MKWSQGVTVVEISVRIPVLGLPKLNPEEVATIPSTILLPLSQNKRKEKNTSFTYIVLTVFTLYDLVPDYVIYSFLTRYQWKMTFSFAGRINMKTIKIGIWTKR